MATIHFDQEPRLTPEQDIGGLTDVTPGRPTIVSNMRSST